MACLWDVKETDMPREEGVCQEAEENKIGQVGWGHFSRLWKLSSGIWTWIVRQQRASKCFRLRGAWWESLRKIHLVGVSEGGVETGTSVGWLSQPWNCEGSRAWPRGRQEGLMVCVQKKDISTGRWHIYLSGPNFTAHLLISGTMVPLNCFFGIISSHIWSPSSTLFPASENSYYQIRFKPKAVQGVIKVQWGLVIFLKNKPVSP